jgi:hypothetical protein
MNKEEMVYHLRGRWKEVEEFERRELRASTIKQNWLKLNRIMLRAKRLKLSRKIDDNEIQVFLRWAKIKERYETSNGITNLL